MKNYIQTANTWINTKIGKMPYKICRIKAKKGKIHLTKIAATIREATTCAAIIMIVSNSTFAAEPITRDIVPVPVNNSSKIDLTLYTANGQDTIAIGETAPLCFYISSSGFASIWDIGTSGKIHRIYPYPDKDFEKLQPGKKCVGYGKEQNEEYQFTVSGPEGINNMFLFFTEKEEDQIIATEFNSEAEFANGIAKKAKDVVAERVDGWNGWATAKATIRIIDKNKPENNYYNSNDGGINNNRINNNINNMAQTISSYNNVYIVAYGANTGDLQYPDQDAEDFVKAVQKSFNIPASNIRLFKNAKQQDFEEGFKWVKEHANNKDSLLYWYYSGHGLTLPDQPGGDENGGEDEALVPTDAIVNDKLNIGKLILDDYLKEQFDSLKTGAIITVMDSCFSGGMYKGLPSDMFNARSKFLNKGKYASQALQFHNKGMKTKGPESILDGAEKHSNHRALIAASQELELSLEIPGEGGAFTTGLINALQNKGKAQDWQKMSELLIRNVQRTTNQRQNPTVIDPDNILSTLQLQ